MFLSIHTFHLSGKTFSDAIGEAVIGIFLARLSLEIQLLVLGQRHLLEVVLHMCWGASLELPRLGRGTERVDAVQEKVLVVDKDEKFKVP